MDGHQSTHPILGGSAAHTRRWIQRAPPSLRAALAGLVAAVLIAGCAPTAVTSVETGAHLQAPIAPLTPLQQLRRMAPAPGLQLPDPLRAARQALRDEMVDEQGIASWYGPGLHGRRTASGERFNTHDFTAAHPHYAFGTRLCVLSRDGKAVEVRVNDRGPYAKNRIIDLSRAAAEALDMVDSGVRRVQLWKLDAEETCDDRLDVLAAAAEAG